MIRQLKNFSRINGSGRAHRLKRGLEAKGHTDVMVWFRFVTKAGYYCKTDTLKSTWLGYAYVSAWIAIRELP